MSYCLHLFVALLVGVGAVICHIVWAERRNSKTVSGSLINKNAALMPDAENADQ